MDIPRKMVTPLVGIDPEGNEKIRVAFQYPRRTRTLPPAHAFIEVIIIFDVKNGSNAEVQICWRPHERSHLHRDMPAWCRVKAYVLF
jgi:hypothetical protein